MLLIYTPCPFSDGSTDQVLDPGSFQGVEDQFEETGDIEWLVFFHDVYAHCNAIWLASCEVRLGFSWRMRYATTFQAVSLMTQPCRKRAAGDNR
jgi:hypothetical protein